MQLVQIPPAFPLRRALPHLPAWAQRGGLHLQKTRVKIRHTSPGASNGHFTNAASIFPAAHRPHAPFLLLHVRRTSGRDLPPTSTSLAFFSAYSPPQPTFRPNITAQQARLHVSFGSIAAPTDPAPTDRGPNSPGGLRPSQLPPPAHLRRPPAPSERPAAPSPAAAAAAPTVRAASSRRRTAKQRNPAPTPRDSDSTAASPSGRAPALSCRLLIGRPRAANRRPPRAAGAAALRAATGEGGASRRRDATPTVGIGGNRRGRKRGRGGEESRVGLWGRAACCVRREPPPRLRGEGRRRSWAVGLTIGAVWSYLAIVFSRSEFLILGQVAYKAG